MKSVTYFTKDGFSICEGGPRCLHMSWGKVVWGYRLFVHIYIRHRKIRSELIIKIS